MFGMLYLRECFSELEACKELSVLGVLGSDGDAGQHEAGDELQVYLDVKPVGDKRWLLVRLSINSKHVKGPRKHQF